jgi:hypothetical protein
MLLSNLHRRIKNWYEGEFIPYENDPNLNIFILGGNQEIHWTAKIARWIISFWSEHWKFIITILVAVTGLYLKLKP